MRNEEGWLVSQRFIDWAMIGSFVLCAGSVALLGFSFGTMVLL
jgi:hypothetical protein